MVYKIKVVPKHERETQIALKRDSTTEKSAFHEYQSETQQLPVIRLPIELPIYRIANGRTRTSQLQHVRSHKLAEDFFSSGQENEETQQAQHGILSVFSKKGPPPLQPDTTALEKDGRQTEPILITASGVVVNGNRRLAAMREYYATGESAFASF